MTFKLNRTKIIEWMTFENHTECECIQKSSLHSNGGDSRPTMLPVVLNDGPASKLITASDVTSTTEMTQRCQCPKYFTQINGFPCKCDCTAKKTDDMCIKLKTGAEHFSIIERRRVLVKIV